LTPCGVCAIMKISRDKCAIMKNTEQLINNVIGQLEGVKKMMADNRDCLTVLIQLKAAKAALSSATAKLLSDNLLSCSTESKGKQSEQIKQLITELIKN